MRTLYIKAKNGKFAGSLPNPRDLALPVPSLPAYPTPQIEKRDQASSSKANDIDRWNLATAKNVGLREEVRIYKNAQEKVRAKKIAGLTFVGVQAGFIGGIATLTGTIGVSPAVSIIAILGLPITLALASLPAREYFLASQGQVAKSGADII